MKRLTSNNPRRAQIAPDDRIVNFYPNGSNFISDPITDEEADAMASHPSFGITETEEDFTPAALDPTTIDLSDSVLVKRYLETLTLFELADVVNANPGCELRIVQSLPAEAMTPLVAEFAPTEDVLVAATDPVTLLTSWLAVNAENGATLLAADLKAAPAADPPKTGLVAAVAGAVNKAKDKAAAKRGQMAADKAKDKEADPPTESAKADDAKDEKSDESEGDGEPKTDGETQAKDASHETDLGGNGTATFSPPTETKDAPETKVPDGDKTDKG